MNPSRLPDVSTLFPWHAWLRDRSLRSSTTWLFVALVAVPPLAFTMLPTSGDEPFAATVTFAAYFAVVWFLVLRAVVRPRAIVGGVLAAVTGVAVLVEGPLAVAMEKALGSDPEHVVPSIVTVGVPEELAKMLPVVALVLWCRQRGRPLPPREVLFIGAVSGLGFGAAEAISYVAPGGTLMTTGDALTVVWRLLSDPVVHACWAGVAGYFLGLASYYRAPGPWMALAAVGVGVPAILHGINDAVAGSALWVAVTAISALLFLAYARVGIAPRTAAPTGIVAPDPVTAPMALGRHHAVR